MKTCGIPKVIDSPFTQVPAKLDEWKATNFEADQNGRMKAKFRKLMGIKDDQEDDGPTELTEEQQKKQKELFQRLDKDYEFARMTTHTQRGVGLGFSSQTQILPNNNT